MTFVEGPVTVEVPATSANLGPGFDCLGLALDLHDTLTAVVAESLLVEVEGEGVDELPRDEEHLVVRALRAAFEVMSLPAPAVHLRCTNRIPQSRGLGSSSAAIVGGIALARALAENDGVRLDDRAALALANRLEGHPDNVAPALLGGFVVSGHDGDDVWALRAAFDARLSAVAFVPPTGLRTEIARGLLPETVSHHDAAAAAGRAALLVAALAGEPSLLLRATDDFLHQTYREPAMPESLALVGRLRAAEVPAVVSGAGPTVLALVGDVDPLQPADRVAVLAPDGWAAMPLAIDERGCRTF